MNYKLAKQLKDGGSLLPLQEKLNELIEAHNEQEERVATAESKIEFIMENTRALGEAQTLKQLYEDKLLVK